MIFYIADTHFGHAAVIRMCNRPFESVLEMDETIIMNWNTKVHKDDTVYIVGDFAYKNEESTDEYLRKLNGKKILVLGNHDKGNHSDMFEKIVPITHTFDPTLGGHHISICHYPLVTWPGKLQSFMIFGHVHNNTGNDPEWLFIKQNERLLNAGVDINNFEPVTLEELIENNKRFKSLH